MDSILIDLDKIKNISLSGIRRTAVFLGFGLNSVNDETFKDYNLTKVSFLEFVPPNLNENTIKHFKEEYGHWIVANGLRELTETFSIFLDKVWGICDFINKDTIPNLKKIKKNYHHQGIETKLEYLEEYFGVTSSINQYLTEINEARNCYTHRRGIVGNRDFNFEKHLRIRWLGIDIYTLNEKGDNEFIRPPIPEKGLSFPSERHIHTTTSTRELLFELGSQIRLSPCDLAEICSTFAKATNDVFSSFITFAKTQGVNILEKSSENNSQ